MFFIQVVHGRPGGNLQFSAGGSTMAWLASLFSSIHSTVLLFHFTVPQQLDTYLLSNWLPLT